LKAVLKEQIRAWVKRWPETAAQPNLVRAALAFGRLSAKDRVEITEKGIADLKALV
jgi:hypothetical protein